MKAKIRISYSWVTLRIRKMKNTFGYWKPKNKHETADATITIDSRVKGLLFCHTFMHEIGHQVEHTSGFELTEEQIDAIARGYTEAIFASGIIDPEDFEQRVRNFCKDS